VQFEMVHHLPACMQIITRTAATMMSVADFGAWIANVASSVLIIFVNKLLMGSKGYAFNYAVTLSGLHYLAAATLMQGYKWSGQMSAKGVMPWKDRLLYTGVSSVSIISLNVSLLLNNVRHPFLILTSMCLRILHGRVTDPIA
jgi:hypothetical protein